MIAGAQVRQKGLRDRCQTRAEQARAITPFQLGDQVFESEGRRIAAGAIAQHPLAITASAGVAHLCEVVEQHGA
ncbi:hypothetical protein D3C76_1816220 [compost metagenome]